MVTPAPAEHSQVIAMGSRRERLHGLVRGALVAAIHDHGPVTIDNVDSAAKRVAGQLVNEAHALADAAVLERFHKRYASLKHGHQRALVQIEGLRRHMAELEGRAS